MAALQVQQLLRRHEQRVLLRGRKPQSVQPQLRKRSLYSTTTSSVHGVSSIAQTQRRAPLVTERVRWFSSSGMKYVTSDHIDARLLEGLTAASDETRPVNLIQDKEGAKRVLQKIRELGPTHFHACDTEVGQIDVKAVGPVGNGNVRVLVYYEVVRCNG
jgi:hypothetical protein